MYRILIQVSLAALALVCGPPSHAQNYPGRTVTIIAPVAAGASSDIMARILADKLRKQWGQTVIVENRPGAGLNIGAEVVAKAPHDGYTLLFTPQGPLVANKSLYAKLNYDPDALAPVSVVVKVPLVLVVNPKVPAHTVDELIDYAKAHPGKLNYASSGGGSTPHLTAELLGSKAGISLVHVPYKSNPPAVNDLMGGQVHLMFLTLGQVLPHIRTGKLRALAIVSDQRNALLPNSPTMSETLPGFSVAPWWGMAAPANTPTAITTKVAADVAAALKQPDVVKWMEDQGGFEAVGSTPADMARFMTQERKLWGDLIRAIGATAD